MNDKLHAAGFVKETLEDQSLLRRQTAQGRMACGEIFNEFLGGRFVSSPLRRKATAKRPPRPHRFASSVAIFARSLDTACESSSVRPGASPSQKGIVGGMPCASATRTVPRSTRKMR